MFDVGPGVVNFGAHYFPIGVEFEDNIEVAFWFHPDDQPPETVASVEIHHLIDQFGSRYIDSASWNTDDVPNWTNRFA